MYISLYPFPLQELYAVNFIYMQKETEIEMLRSTECLLTKHKHHGIRSVEIYYF